MVEPEDDEEFFDEEPDKVALSVHVLCAMLVARPDQDLGPTEVSRAVDLVEELIAEVSRREADEVES